MSAIQRRSFLYSLAALLPAKMFGAVSAPVTPAVQPLPIHRDQDRYGPMRKIPNGTSTFKVSTKDCRGDFFAMEHSHTAKGGPPRHVHSVEDEWFYVLEGEYLVQVGDTVHTLKPGDSVLGPRGVPHAFAFNGVSTGRLLITYAPGGRMEEFFDGQDRSGARAKAYPSDAARMSEFGMTLLGPPLKVS